MRRKLVDAAHSSHVEGVGALLTWPVEHVVNRASGHLLSELVRRELIMLLTCGVDPTMCRVRHEVQGV